MIEKLKLQNWKSHLDSEFEFGKGTNVLIGIMGSGKSSVLSAISFALFGTFPAHRSREVKLDEVIMNRPQKKEKSVVELWFRVGEDEFHVKRVVERDKGTTEAHIRKNGKMLDSGASRTTGLVEKYLKVDYELFSRAVYSEQDGMDYFLEIPKGQRMKKIDSLLRIDRFEKCRSNTTTLINRLKDRIESRSELIEQMEEEEDFGKIEELEDSLEELEEEIKEGESRKSEKSEKLEKLEEEIKEAKEGIEELNRLKNKKSSLEGAVSSIQSDLDSLKDKLELSKDKLEERLDELKEGLEDKEKKKDELKERKEELKEEKQRKEVKIKDLQQRIQRLKKVEGKCPICDSKLTDRHKKGLEEERREKISELSDDREEIKKRLKNVEQRLEEVKSYIEKGEKERRELEKKLEKYEDLEEKEEKLREKKEEIRDVGEKIEKYSEKYDQDKIEERRGLVQELSGEVRELKANIKNNRKLAEERKERLEELKEKKENFESYKEDIEKSKNINEDLKKFRSALKNTQEQLRRRFIEAVNKTLSKIWSDLYPYEDFENLKLTVKEGDYELQFRRGGSWQSVEGVASGGERTASCLALRIAFSLVLAPNLRWLVLDEPTHNLDARTVEDLAELLRTEVSELVEQVFLITHDENMETAANSYLYELERDKQKNEPTVVKEVT